MPQATAFLLASGVGLHVLDEDDASTVSTWMNDPDVSQFFMTPKPFSIGYTREWIRDINQQLSGNTPGHLAFGIVTSDREFCGIVGLKDIDYRHGTAEITNVIGDKQKWNRGIGYIARMTLLQYAFLELGLRKVRCHIVAHNERSLRSCLRSGYVQEGLLRQEVRHGQMLVDVYILASFRADWLPRWQEFMRDEAKWRDRAASVNDRYAMAEGSGDR